MSDQTLMLWPSLYLTLAVCKMLKTHTYTPNPNKVYQLFAILGMIEMLFSNLLTNTVKPVNKGHSWEQYTFILA